VRFDPVTRRVIRGKRPNREEGLLLSGKPGQRPEILARARQLLSM
jgi:hypothetical protein